jgi:hypothetical protein
MPQPLAAPFVRHSVIVAENGLHKDTEGTIEAVLRSLLACAWLVHVRVAGSTVGSSPVFYGRFWQGQLP